MANESPEFKLFTDSIKRVFNSLDAGKAYFVVDTVSKDNTLDLCQELSKMDVMKMTPIDALLKLNQLKNQLELN